jgi:2-dehydro-3-deoxyphosphooctonate aldolase (KDO 8-P synthase)
MQTPAFLCRQTNFIQAVAEQGKPVNIKKGQFSAPWDMVHVVDKAKATGNQQIMVGYLMLRIILLEYPLYQVPFAHFL